MSATKEASMPVVENISCILPETMQLGGLYLGNIFGAQNADILKQYGIRAVITTSAETKINHKFEDIPFHMSFEAHDKEDYYISEHINDCIHFIEQNRKFTNVYVHCYAGVSRSSAVVCAYLMWKYRWPLDKAIAFLTFKRVVAKPNDGFMKQLKEVQAKLNITSEKRTSNTTVSRAQRILNPISSQHPQQMQVQHQRPLSTREIPIAEKPQSPPLSKMMGQKLAVSPQSHNYPFNTDYGTQSRHRTVHGETLDSSKRHSQYGSQKMNQRMPVAHNQVPIPRILNRKSQYKKEEFRQEEQRNKNSMYNDYMISPQMKPGSPKYALPPKGFGTKMTNTGSNFGSQYKSSEGNSFRDIQTSVNSTNYSRKQYQFQEKTKKTSRCLIRPRDLPGYKNY